MPIFNVFSKIMNWIGIYGSYQMWELDRAYGKDF